MYINIDLKYTYHAFTGGPVVNIATVSKDGVADCMTAAWNCPFDTDELLLVLSTEHTTSENIRQGSKIVVAIPGNTQVDDLLKLGSVHGRDVGDKFKATGVAFEPSQKYGINVIKDALAYFEGECSDMKLFEQKGICLVKVSNVYVKEEMWDKNKNVFTPGCFNSVHHVSGGTFCCGSELING